jgi:hypothetical protein
LVSGGAARPAPGLRGAASPARPEAMLDVVEDARFA